MNDDRQADALLEIDGVSLGYRRLIVLEAVSLTIGRGQFWVFVGPNGRGKSTLVQAILGCHRPSAGTIRLAPAIRRGTHVGFVPQSSLQNRTLSTTLGEFVDLGTVGLRLDRRTRRERLAAALAAVQLTGSEGRNYWQLSGGQRQRALIARALVRQPALLVLDEPTTGLDVAAEQALFGCLGQLHRAGLALILVTHDLSLASRTATHAALFGERRVEAGLAADLLRPERLATTFGTRPEAIPPLAVAEPGVAP